MSGIVGLYHADGAPLDAGLLARLTRAIRFRGPNHQQTWSQDHVGFGHTLLKTTWQSEHEQQPYHFDGVCIVADARLDGRDELIERLESRSERIAPRPLADSELILQAYRTWGEDCVSHLLGDFAFAIWNGRANRLFCARDQLGIKPFYYAYKCGCFAFSNTLNCLRLHPQISNELNELAVADFLLFEQNQETNTTTFADVQKLPPAHTLTVSSHGGLKVRRYWTLPTESRYRFPRSVHYVERFTELLEQAVQDRTRLDKMSVLMSGGLDSSSVVATAKRLSRNRSEPLQIHAHTAVYDRLMPDRERHYSGLVAHHLDIPIHYLAADDYQLFDRWERPDFPRPEPTPGILELLERDIFTQAASTARVAFSGDGGDAVLCPPHGYLAALLKRGRLGTVLRSGLHLWRTTRRFPRIGLRFMLHQTLRSRTVAPSYPEWLNRDLERRLHLHERWRYMQDIMVDERSDHPRREACAFLRQPYWSYWFEMQDPGATREALEIRYPFFDVRLVDFMLGIPPIPWCVEKNILRITMEGRLPEEVRLRPKTPLVSDGLTERRGQVLGSVSDSLTPTADLGRFVDIGKLSKEIPATADALWRALAPLSLDWWLRHFRGLPVVHGGTA
jgi:asparagine synthase (glutamine-hydrolysing)